MKGFVLDLLDGNTNVVHSEKYSKGDRNIVDRLMERGQYLLQSPKSLSLKGVKPVTYRIRKV